MLEPTLVNLIVLPLGLGLLGFIEPCSLGSSLLFVKYLEGKAAITQVAQTGVFILTRARLIGALGAVAALVGAVYRAGEPTFERDDYWHKSYRERVDPDDYRSLATQN